MAVSENSNENREPDSDSANSELNIKIAVATKIIEIINTIRKIENFSLSIFNFFSNFKRLITTQKSRLGGLVGTESGIKCLFSSMGLCI